ncbi:hypothetical protein K458DRAFT_66817 [Lentithecium fluviatile CBS 122367]|uniref:Uncharacterized protein n=1 Tax=Lentithecium fluviatile CBS 122367 TaxID=1168545 RepID=A0A6G1JKH1_9PLEO|nr:hypothetical protein K458DRAFT_66817 [Lentithecium fluviatile CBS 122367]
MRWLGKMDEEAIEVGVNVQGEYLLWVLAEKKIDGVSIRKRVRVLLKCLFSFLVYTYMYIYPAPQDEPADVSWLLVDLVDYSANHLGGHRKRRIGGMDESKQRCLTCRALEVDRPPVCIV